MVKKVFLRRALFPVYCLKSVGASFQVTDHLFIHLFFYLFCCIFILFPLFALSSLGVVSRELTLLDGTP